MCAVQGKVYLLPVQSVRIQPGRDCLFSGQRHQCGARIGRCPPTGEYKGVTIVLHIQNQAASGFLTRQPTVTNQIVLGYSIFNCRNGIGKHEVRSGNCFDLGHGKPRLVSSYSLLQTQFFEHMRQAGFTDFERGVQGSDAEHLNVLEYKVQKDRQTVAELSDQTKQLQGQQKELISQVKNISSSIRDVADIEQRAKTKGVLEKRVELPVQDFQTLCEMAKASGKLQAENRSLWMQLQQSTVRGQELRQRLHRCEEQLDAVLTETRPYREAMRVAPEQVQAFVLGICRRQQEEKGLNRQQRRQRAKGQDR